MNEMLLIRVFYYVCTYFISVFFKTKKLYCFILLRMYLTSIIQIGPSSVFELRYNVENKNKIFDYGGFLFRLASFSNRKRLNKIQSFCLKSIACYAKSSLFRIHTRPTFNIRRRWLAGKILIPLPFSILSIP